MFSGTRVCLFLRLFLWLLLTRNSEGVSSVNHFAKLTRNGGLLAVKNTKLRTRADFERVKGYLHYFSFDHRPQPVLERSFRVQIKADGPESKNSRYPHSPPQRHRRLIILWLTNLMIFLKSLSLLCTTHVTKSSVCTFIRRRYRANGLLSRIKYRNPGIWCDPSVVPVL